MSLVRITTIFLMLLATSAIAAGNPLDAFFDELDTLRADFSQRVMNESGEVLQQAAGKVWIERPGRFRWDYETPYRQLVLTDGERLWNYDEDLEQAIVKPVDEVLSSTPAMLLSGNRPLADLFLVTDLGDREGIHWMELQPRSEETAFQRIRLGFDRAMLAHMEMQDGFGQTTRFDFSGVQRNPDLAPGLFRFSPPPGVDVIGED